MKSFHTNTKHSNLVTKLSQNRHSQLTTSSTHSNSFLLSLFKRCIIQNPSFFTYRTSQIAHIPIIDYINVGLYNTLQQRPPKTLPKIDTEKRLSCSNCQRHIFQTIWLHFSRRQYWDIFEGKVLVYVILGKLCPKCPYPYQLQALQITKNQFSFYFLPSFQPDIPFQSSYSHHHQQSLQSLPSPPFNLFFTVSPNRKLCPHLNEKSQCRLEMNKGKIGLVRDSLAVHLMTF